MAECEVLSGWGLGILLFPLGLSCKHGIAVGMGTAGMGEGSSHLHCRPKTEIWDPPLTQHLHISEIWWEAEVEAGDPHAACKER